MASETIIVKGYRECIRALAKVDSEINLAVRGALREAAQPIAEDAKGRISRYQGASLGTIGPRISTRGVFVTQRAKKVTGLRPDFGALQMEKGMIPALQDHAGQVEEGVAHALDVLVATAGFH